MEKIETVEKAICFAAKNKKVSIKNLFFIIIEDSTSSILTGELYYFSIHIMYPKKHNL